MNVRIVDADSSHTDLIKHLMQLYLYEESEFTGEDVDDYGLFRYPYFLHYWVDADRFPILIRVDSNVAGFALVRRDVTETSMIAEFFILRKYRRRSIGTIASHKVFRRFPGRWQVAQDRKNPSATRFWKHSISTFGNGEFIESWSEKEPNGPKQLFDSPQTVAAAFQSGTAANPSPNEPERG